jgi:tetratricopeptide (TPR) repeat protein
MDERNINELDFEIQFYEDLLKDKPDFIDALVLLGEVYTRRGLYQKGLTVDKHLVTLRPNDPVVQYNLACSYSLTGDVERSLEALEDAVKKGYGDLEFMNSDPDLANTRQDKRFGSFIGHWEKKVGGDAHGVWIVKENRVQNGEKAKEKGTSKKRTVTKAASGKKKKGNKKTKAPRRNAKS